MAANKRASRIKRAAHGTFHSMRSASFSRPPLAAPGAPLPVSTPASPSPSPVPSPAAGPSAAPEATAAAPPPPSIRELPAAARNITGPALPAASPQPAPELSALSARLREAWLHPCFLYKHESREAFGKLLERHLSAWRPATPAEERLVFRLAQTAWRIERADTLERVLADSAVTQLRKHYPALSAAAALALNHLDGGDSGAILLRGRLAQQRHQCQINEHRLESRLLRLQQQRENRLARCELRRQPSVRMDITESEPPRTTTGIHVSRSGSSRARRSGNDPPAKPGAFIL